MLYHERTRERSSTFMVILTYIESATERICSFILNVYVFLFIYFCFDAFFGIILTEFVISIQFFYLRVVWPLYKSYM
jgi:hypothetical protein